MAISKQKPPDWIIKLIFNILSLHATAGIQTLDLRIKSRVLYHCATGFGANIIKTKFD